MASPLQWSLDHPELLVGWIEAESLEVGESDPELSALLDAVIEEPERQGLDESCRKAIRDLLRGRGYKPSGRGKPASEFLAGAASKGRFPRINNVVDINNLISLESGWPISVFDLDRATEADIGLEIRFGADGEAFVFNPAGQSIDVGGLIVVSRADGTALGNPVKDSMTTKIDAETRRLLAVIYASREQAEAGEVDRVARRYGELLGRHAGAEAVRTGVLEQG